MKILTYEQAVEILDKAVKERGEDWVFPHFDKCDVCQSDDWEDYEPCSWHYSGGCRYFSYDGSPACLVGYVIRETVDTTHLNLQDIEAHHALDALQILEDWGVLEVDDRTAEMLYKAQGLQDNGIAWGEAVSDAIRLVPNV